MADWYLSVHSVTILDHNMINDIIGYEKIIELFEEVVQKCIINNRKYCGYCIESANRHAHK